MTKKVAKQLNIPSTTNSPNWFRNVCAALEKIPTLPIIASLLIIAVFVLFIIHPHVSTNSSSGSRQHVLQAFLSSVVTHQNVDGRMFWQFRESYSSGSFFYSLDTIHMGEGQRFAPHITGPIMSPTKLYSYQSKRIQSGDYVIPASVLRTHTQSAIFQQFLQIPIDPKRVWYQSPTVILYQTSPNTLRLLFIDSLEQMEKANGFFSYTGVDGLYFFDTAWLNVTDITLDCCRNLRQMLNL